MIGPYQDRVLGGKCDIHARLRYDTFLITVLLVPKPHPASVVDKFNGVWVGRS